MHDASKSKHALILGAHMSIAGGYYKAVEAAAAAGMSTCQIFTKNNNQWRAKELTDDDVAKFRGKLSELNISHPISHSSYLINLGSPKPDLWQKSVDALVIEMQRAERLGLLGVVVHPGSYTTASEEEGIQNIIRGLDELHSQTSKMTCRCLLETTAGQGSNLGWKFEQLAKMIDGVKHPELLGVCFDTCHVFAAGYPLATPDEYAETMEKFDSHIGLDRIVAFHLNDSKRELGSRKDRHEHIGLGELGLEPFRNLLNDARFENIPMYLETAKGIEDDEDLDVRNLNVLRSLIEDASD
jgi:deoxyribonuclease IV